MRPTLSFKFCLFTIVLSNQAFGTFLQGPTSNVWTEEQCQSITQEVTDLETCQIKCMEDDRCTAITFHTTFQACVLKACPRPVPVPTGTFLGYVGYYKTPELKCEECCDENIDCPAEKPFCGENNFCEEFHVGPVDTLCESGMIDNLSDCKKAAQQLNSYTYIYFEDEEEELDSFPGGCYMSMEIIYFNKNFAGTSHQTAAPICGQGEDEDDITNEILEQNDDQDTKENDLTEIVTPGEFLQCLDKVRSFAQSNGVSEEIQKALSDLEALGVTKK